MLNAAKQDAQTPEGMLADAIANVTTEVRGYVSANQRNTLGLDGTIPDELESSALALLRRYLFTRLPGMRSLYDAIRADETKDALERLRDTAAGKFAIVPPDTAAPDQAAGPSVQLVHNRQRIGRREDLNGL